MENRSLWIDNNLPSFCNLETPQYKHIPEYHNVWPNPFNSKISIGFTTFSAGDVVIEITDIFGRPIRKVNLGAKHPGTHAVSFSELNLESGNYLYMVRQDGSILHSGKMVKI